MVDFPSTAIETHTGLMFNYADPQPEQVCIEDIAHALSLSCRFGGHINRFYSVAQHALLVERLVYTANLLHPRLPALRRAALHHDSHEAYVGDIPTPMKRALQRESLAVDHLAVAADFAICAALEIDVNLIASDAVAAADRLALRIEATALKVNGGETFAEAAGTLPVHAQQSVRSILNSDIPGAWEFHFIRQDDWLQRLERNRP